jgi:hypothetical protein
MKVTPIYQTTRRLVLENCYLQIHRLEKLVSNMATIIYCIKELSDHIYNSKAKSKFVPAQAVTENSHIGHCAYEGVLIKP